MSLLCTRRNHIHHFFSNLDHRSRQSRADVVDPEWREDERPTVPDTGGGAVGNGVQAVRLLIVEVT
jgi:hypothetical protein